MKEPSDLILYIERKTLTKMQKKIIKEENDYLLHTEVEIKTEPQEHESEFQVVAGTSYDEPMVKIEYEDIVDDLLQDPLDVTTELEAAVQAKEGPLNSVLKDETIQKAEECDEKEQENILARDEWYVVPKKINSKKEKIDQIEKNKKYTCHICQKFCNKKFNLDCHLRIHTGEKPFSCHICQRSFSIRRTLDRHILIHIGEKPYACDVCKNNFRQKCDLKKHKLTHVVKLFSCSECNEAFLKKCDLVTHERIHTGGKFICDICGSAFTRKATLNVHKRLHTGLKPFSCDICKKSFNQKSNLKIHQKVHKKKNEKKNVRRDRAR